MTLQKNTALFWLVLLLSQEITGIAYNDKQLK